MNLEIPQYNLEGERKYDIETILGQVGRGLELGKRRKEELKGKDLLHVVATAIAGAEAENELTGGTEKTRELVKSAFN